MQPSKTALNKILRECSFDPRAPGKMKVISDMADPDYLRKRAIEMLNEATYNLPQENTLEAIRLLTLAIYHYRSQGKKEYTGTPKFQVNRNTIR